MYKEIVKRSRRVMRLQLLKLLGHQLALTVWSTNSKRVIWAACVLAFFGSFHFGEILAKEMEKFNPMEKLLWSELKKNGKSSNVQCEMLFIFSTRGWKICMDFKIGHVRSIQECPS